MNVKFWGFRFVLAQWQTEINSCNLTQVVVIFRQSLYFLFQNFLQSSIYVVHKLDLNLITLINCCFKFFRMVLLSPFLNEIKMGVHWTLKNLFNNLFNSILDDSLHSFIGNFYHSSHFAIFSEQPLKFILLFLSKKTFIVNFMWLWKFKYICMQVFIYVVMFSLPASHNLL